MRCPKCHYISFDSGERCRNCGYDFSLTVDVKPMDFPLQDANAPVGPLADFALSGAPAASDDAFASPSAALGSERESVGAGEVPLNTSVAAGELPLFTSASLEDDRPLVTAPAVPRTPLSVRRSTPVIARTRGRGADADEPTLDLGVPGRHRPHRTSGERGEMQATAGAPEAPAAALVRRLFAAAIDAIIVGSIHAAVIYFTLRLCGLTFDDIRAVPPVPMIGFLLLLTGGYVVSFTVAGGQTIGKMISRIRVVPTPETDGGAARVPFGNAVVRAVACLVSVLPAGAGLIPALFSADHRAIHDRLSDTRVVKA
jgi:uncharacterized RDD family membrane protein YckC